MPHCGPITTSTAIVHPVCKGKRGKNEANEANVKTDKRMSKWPKVKKRERSTVKVTFAKINCQNSIHW